MTRSELEQLTDCGHDLAAKVALAIIAAANVGPCNMEVQVDGKTLAVICNKLELYPTKESGYWVSHVKHSIRLTFMEVDAVIYARVQR
jgi:hypothetical protein